ncbi:MAG: hypothetical protein RIR00_1235 [Pseudomonadota bacterium]
MTDPAGKTENTDTPPAERPGLYPALPAAQGRLAPVTAESGGEAVAGVGEEAGAGSDPEAGKASGSEAGGGKGALPAASRRPLWLRRRSIGALGLFGLGGVIAVAGLWGGLWSDKDASDNGAQSASDAAASAPSPSEEAIRTFTDNYDAEKIANHYAARFGRNPDELLSIVHHTAVAARENKLSPFLLLAIIAHESRFLPSARNNAGAEGLMQIVSTVHKKRYAPYGGIRMAYLPEVNIRIGATILRDCIALTKSVRGGLRCYAGAINSDDAFVDYVLGEATMIKRMASLSPGR